MEFTNEPTPIAYPVFVVWKTITKEDGSTTRKARVAVDIQGLNKITMPDSYPLPRQSDTIAEVKDCPFTFSILMMVRSKTSFLSAFSMLSVNIEHDLVRAQFMTEEKCLISHISVILYWAV